MGKMISNQREQTLEQIILETGYDIYFKNLELEEEILQHFPSSAANPLLSRLCVTGSSSEPIAHYLDKLVETTDFLQQVANQESSNSTFLDIIKSMDVSESLSYMFGEGLEKDIARIEEEYNDTLQLLEKALPAIPFGKRYPFTDQMRKFCRLYLAHALKPLAKTMGRHQEQLGKTFELFKRNMKNKNELQSAYLISRLAGSLLGGIAGSLAIRAIFVGLNSNGEREFSQELSFAHQTWYQIQTANLTDTVTANYKPRLHHLCLSMIGGLWLAVQKDLRALTLEITDFDFTGTRLSIELHKEGKERFAKRIEEVLRSSDLAQIASTIRTFASFPQLASLADTNNHLYIEKLYVHYLYAKADTLLAGGKPVPIEGGLPSLNWKMKRVNPSFSFLEEDSYNEIFETIKDAFYKYPDEMHWLYKDMIEVNQLFTWGDAKKTRKVLNQDYLSALYITSCIISKRSVPEYDIETLLSYKETYLLPIIQVDKYSQAHEEIIHQWIPLVQKESRLARFFGKRTEAGRLQQAIKSLDYRTVEKMLQAGSIIESLTITKDMVSPGYRHFLKLLAESGRPAEIKVSGDLLLQVIEQNDNSALQYLLELGVNPFTPLDDTYLLARITTEGNFAMTYNIYEHCMKTLEHYQASVRSLPDDQLTPYYFLYISGKTCLPEKYPELIQSIPVERRERELAMAVSSLTSRLLWEMFRAGYDDRFISLAETNEDSFFKILCSTAHYQFLNEMHDFKPALLETRVQGIPMLREVYELGHPDLAWHFHEVFEIHEIGQVTYDDVEKAAVADLNENYLILLNQTVNGIDEVFTKIMQDAQHHGHRVIIELIDRVR
ncbi:hypothetical protein M9R32_08585 [Paenisporosarcina quisquiliarum]|uniref:Uncharacterized protein n=1 Tax=Paenisporosarcina quisquiliarum TaxID=365346 RepID=A0A9X3LFT9_9BACL|nr:hypothetical protein [Paenisporosarcina quisquiliarum]MCZ8537233.1 hypothetical protein [Paenisporosarcina quisquiliarum]